MAEVEMIHSAKPWFIGDDDKNGQSVIRNRDIEIATCWHHCVGAIEKEMRGNARLIAAAPDLLDALKEAFIVMAGKEGSNAPFDTERWAKAVNAVEAAIAKAEVKS